MTPPELGDILGLAALAVGLLVVRGIGAAFEAAMVAVGSPRAQDLARPPDARGRARALADLFEDPEGTSFTGRALVTFATVFARSFRHISSMRARSCASGTFSSRVSSTTLPSRTSETSP